MSPALTKHLSGLVSGLVTGALLVVVIFESLLATSLPLETHQQEKVDRAIALLEMNGLERDAFLLRHAAFYRSSDNWLNYFAPKENAFASTNMPFAIVTLYPDFYSRAKDDTERAMILLHESRHLRGESEASAYAYVWRNREKLNWTQLRYGATEVYVSVELQTREFAPDVFSCTDRLWNDCTAQKRPIVSN